MVSKPELVLISVSGAQATGKSTLLAACADDLLKKAGVTAIRTPSFGTRLFERWKGYKLTNAPFPVQSFDQIDERGHREWFQRQLPEALSFEVELALQAIKKAKTAQNYLLVDRWFPDIMAHTRLGLRGPNDDVTHRQIRRLCRDRNTQLLAAVSADFTLLHVPVFVPVSVSDFSVEGQEGKFRATTDRAEFETLCLQEWPAIMDRQPSLTIASPDLSTRVFDVKVAVTAARTAHARPSTSRT